MAEIAKELGIHLITLSKWRKAWRLTRLTGARHSRAGPERLWASDPGVRALTRRSLAPDAAAQGHPPHAGLATALIDPIARCTPANEAGPGVSAKSCPGCGWDPMAPTAHQLLASTLGVTEPTARTGPNAGVSVITRECQQQNKVALAS